MRIPSLNRRVQLSAAEEDVKVPTWNVQFRSCSCIAVAEMRLLNMAKVKFQYFRGVIFIQMWLQREVPM